MPSASNNMHFVTFFRVTFIHILQGAFIPLQSLLLIGINYGYDLLNVPASHISYE